MGQSELHREHKFSIQNVFQDGIVIATLQHFVLMVITYSKKLKSGHICESCVGIDKPLCVAFVNNPL